MELADAGNSFTIDPDSWLPWIALITAIVTAVVAVGRWTVRALDKRVNDLHQRMEAEVQTRTAQIQPGANGGSSLADANRAVEKVTSSLQRIHVRLDAMEQRAVEQSRDMDGLLNWAAGRPCLWQIDRKLNAAREEDERRHPDPAPRPPDA